jgi:type I restriction enzyme, S subunit
VSDGFQPLGDLAEFINGVAFRPEDWGADGLKIVRIQNLTDPSKPFNFTKREVDNKYLVCKGDILVSWSASLGVFVWDEEQPALVNQHIFRVVPRPLVVDKQYLRHVLVRALTEMDMHLHGATMQHVNRGEFLSTRVFLPSLEEQRRIAAILDKADALRQKRHAALQKLDSLTQSLFLDMFGGPATNPKGLPQIELGEIAQFVGGGTPSREVEAYFRGSICWATSKDMKGEVLQGTQEHITEEAIKQSATKLVEPGAVLVVVKSKVLLHRLPVLINRVPTCFGQDLKAIVLSPQWPARYIARHLRIDQQRLLGQARGINTEGLTLEHLRRYKLLRPPCAELSRYDCAEERIESQRKVSLKATDLLNSQFASLQHRAFRGEL